MAINTDLTMTLKAIDATTSAFNAVNANLNGLKSAALKVGAALVGALAIKDVIQTTEDWGVSVRKLQAVTGLQADQASRLAFVAKTVGIDTDELALSLDRLAKQMFSNSALADKGKDAFSKWGIELKNAQGQTRNINDILEAAATKVQQFGDGAASTALEMDLFGRSGGRLHELLMLGADGVAQLERESDKLGLTLDNNGVKSIVAFQRATNEFGLALDGLKMTIGTFLLPLLTQWINQFIKFVEGIRNGTILSRQFSGVIKTMGEAFRYVLGIVKDVTDKLGRFFDVIGKKGIGGAFLDLAGSLKDELLKVLGDIGTKLDSFGPLGTIAKDALIALGAAQVIASIAGVLLKIKEIALALTSLPTALTISVILVAIGVAEVVQTVQQVTDKWEAWRTAAHNGLLENQGAVGTFVKGLVLFGDDFSRFGAMVNTTWGGIVNGIAGMIATATSNVKQMLYDLTVTLDTIIGKINEVAHTNIPMVGGGVPAPVPSGPVNPFRPPPQAVTVDTGQGVFEIFTPGGGGGGRLMAAGGIVTSPTRAIIGESGPEAVIPLDKAGMGGMNVVINVSGNIATSERELAERIADRVGDVLVRATLANRNLSY